MDNEMKQFQSDLLKSVRQMKAGKGRTTTLKVSTATEARNRVGLSQAAFAALFGVSVAHCKTGSKAGASRPVRQRPCSESPQKIRKW